MPARTPIATVDLKGFAKGLNREADPFLLGIDEVPEALNVDFEANGSVRSRDGYVRYDDTSLTGTPWHAFTFAVPGGSKHLILGASGGGLWHSTGVTFASRSTSWGAATSIDDYPVGMTQFEGIFYGTVKRASKSPQKFDGTTWSNMTAFTGSTASSVFPLAQHLLTRNDQVFAANLLYGSTHHRSRLHWSNPLDAESWDAADFVDFDPDDGGDIRAIASFGEELAVLKDKAIYILAGRSEASFTKYDVTKEFGTLSPKATAVLGDTLMFLDPDRGVIAYDGSGFQRLSDSIRSYLLDGFNRSAVYTASAFVYRDRYFLSVPWGSDTSPSRTFVFDRRSGSWTEYDFGITAATERDGIRYGGGLSGAGAGAFTLFSGNDDDGSAIASSFRTAWLSIEGPDAKHRLRRLDTAWDATLGEDVQVDMYRDFKDSSPYVSQTILTPSGGSEWNAFTWGEDEWGGASAQRLVQSTGWGQRWRAVQFKVSDTSEQWQLNRITLQTSALNRVRGES